MNYKTLAKLNLRKEASKESDVVTILEKGEVIEVQALDNTWASIKTKSGQEGFVMKQFIGEI